MLCGCGDEEAAEDFVREDTAARGEADPVSGLCEEAGVDDFTEGGADRVDLHAAELGRELLEGDAFHEAEAEEQGFFELLFPADVMDVRIARVFKHRERLVTGRLKPGAR